MKQILALIVTFVLWTVVGVASKILFLIIYSDLIQGAGIADYLMVIGYGLRLDVAIAGYLTMLPGLMLILLPTCYRLRMGYNILFALVYSVAIVANLGLYGSWGFPLDSTPILYLKTSPADAMASITLLQMVGAVVSVVLLTASITWMHHRLHIAQAPLRRFTQLLYPGLVTLLLTLLLFIPIRGGLSTGTNHTGTVYFSQNMRLNHAAVNPVFNFIESMTHRFDNIGEMYHTMDYDEATRLVDKLQMFSDNYRPGEQNSACVDTFRLRPAKRPNIVLIGLESFSKYVMTEGGVVEGVTPNLDRLTREGVYFTHFYGNTVRTDRALVSILSGIPALPDLSLMDQPQISTFLPSIARSLGNAGYRTTFYYGGDTNFSNMRSYLIGSGYQQVVSDKDFDYRLHTGKWGVADGPVYDRMLPDILESAKDPDAPFYYTMMTSSSHEPFDVPDYSQLQDPVLNAFSYADHHLGRFIESLRQSDAWSNTLVVIVPDHQGAYPHSPDNYSFMRYELPLVMVGGLVTEPHRVQTLGSQMDIAATLLGIAGVGHSEFRYSKDLFCDSVSHFGWFAFPEAVGLVTDSARVIYDYTQRATVVTQTERVSVNTDELVESAKAYLQLFCKDVADRENDK